MADKTESARATIILALVTVAVGVYVLLFGLQTMFYFQAHRWASSSPFLNEVPQRLPSTTASPIQEKDLSFYNMSFAAPWKGIAAQKPGPLQSEVDFKDGPIIVFFDPGAERDILNGIRDGDVDTYHRYQAVFGADLFPTNFDLYESVYSASPARISPFMRQDGMERIGTLLGWKLAFAANGASAIYSVSTNGMRGLQFGDPSRDRMIVVRMFDSHNHQYRLLLTSKAGPGTFPQEDINCVLDSLKPTPRPE